MFMSVERTIVCIEKKLIKFLWATEIKKKTRRDVIAKPMCGDTFMVFETATHKYLYYWTNWIFSKNQKKNT